MNRQKYSGATYLIIVTILVALGLVGFIGYVAWDKFINKSVDSSTSEKTNNLSDSQSSGDLVEYKFSDSDILIKLPKDWSAGELESSTSDFKLFYLNYPKDSVRFMVSLYEDLSKMPSKESDKETYYANDRSFEGYSKNMTRTSGLSIVDFEKVNIDNGDAYFVSYEKKDSSTNYYTYSLYSRSLSNNKALFFQLNSDTKQLTSGQVESYKQIFSSIKYEK